MNHAEKKIIVIVLLIAIVIASFVYFWGGNFLQILVTKKNLDKDQSQNDQPLEEKVPLNASVTVDIVTENSSEANIMFNFSHQTSLVGFSLDLVVTSAVQISDVTCIAQFSCHSVKADEGRYRVSFLALPNVKAPVMDIGITKIATITYTTIQTMNGSLHVDEVKSEIRSFFSEQNLLKVKMQKFDL